VEREADLFGEEPREVFQPALFDMREHWEEHWQGMPEFVQEDLTAWRQIVVNFATYSDLLAFGDAIGQKVTPNTRSTWYPPAEIGRYENKRYRRHEP